MRRANIILILIIFFTIVWWWRRHDARRAKAKENIEETETDFEMPRPTNSIMPTAASEPGTPAAPPVTASLPPPSDTDPAQTAQAFGQMMQGMASCLQLSKLSVADTEPSTENFLSALRGDLNEPVIQTEDWNTTHITLPGGEVRRLRIEMDYSGEDRVVRRLRYYRLGSGGAAEEIPLSKEQSEDPSDTFVASLEADGQVTSSERSQRIYFGTGEEIIMTEKNGRVSDMEMSRNGHTFRCSKVESLAACTCQ